MLVTVSPLGQFTSRASLFLCAFALAFFALACGTPVAPTPTVYLPGTLPPSPSATPLPTPTPTATPPPAARLAAAEQSMHDGDYAAAASAYQDLLALSPAEEVAAGARLGLGAAYLRDGEFAPAVDALRGLLFAYPESELVPDARFLLADALSGAGDPLGAADEYRAYLAAGTVITAYVNQSLGNVLYAGGELEAAAAAYTAAVGDAPDASFEVWTREALALVHVGLEEYDAAVAQYDAILAVAQIRSYRARIEHQAAETLLLAGQVEAAYTRHLSVVETYPTETYGYNSLVKLVDAGWGVDDYLRGRVDYYAGAYSPAVDAFRRYVIADPEGHEAGAHWYAGLSFLEAGSPGLAAGEFQLLIDTHPGSPLVGDAWMGLAGASRDQGEPDEAVEIYRRFVELLPGHARAPEALWRAAALIEGQGDLAGAAAAYLDCHAAYPGSDYGLPALFRSGLLAYRAGDLAQAAVAWDTLAQVYPESDLHPTALLWLGKLRTAQGEGAAAATATMACARPTCWPIPSPRYSARSAMTRRTTPPSGRPRRKPGWPAGWGWRAGPGWVSWAPAWSPTRACCAGWSCGGWDVSRRPRGSWRTCGGTRPRMAWPSTNWRSCTATLASIAPPLSAPHA